MYESAKGMQSVKKNILIFFFLNFKKDNMHAYPSMIYHIYKIVKKIEIGYLKI